VGYRVRQEAKVGRDTRIEVVTDGILLRRLQSDPSLEGVGAVLLDEFHERSVEVSQRSMVNGHHGQWSTQSTVNGSPTRLWRGWGRCSSTSSTDAVWS
jgi:hypothetical protein